MRSSVKHDSVKHMVKHFLYSGGWKKFEPLWNFIIKTKNLNNMVPLLESVLTKVNYNRQESPLQTPTALFEKSQAIGQPQYAENN